MTSWIRIRSRATACAVALLLSILTVGLGTVGLAGCDEFVPPGKAVTSTTESGQVRVGVEKKTFRSAWDSLKEILVATAMATTLDDFRSQVQDVRVELDAIDQEKLNAEEKQIWVKFDQVCWAYEDSLSLWAADLRASGADQEGIPLYEEGEPLVARADLIVARYGLEVTPSATQAGLEVVPDDSVGALWQWATVETEKWLLPVLGR